MIIKQLMQIGGLGVSLSIVLFIYKRTYEEFNKLYKSYIEYLQKANEKLINVIEKNNYLFENLIEKK